MLGGFWKLSDEPSSLEIRRPTYTHCRESVPKCSLFPLPLLPSCGELPAGLTGTQVWRAARRMKNSHCCLDLILKHTQNFLAPLRENGQRAIPTFLLLLSPCSHFDYTPLKNLPNKLTSPLVIVPSEQPLHSLTHDGKSVWEAAGLSSRLRHCTGPACEPVAIQCLLCC